VNDDDVTDPPIEDEFGFEPAVPVRGADSVPTAQSVQAAQVAQAEQPTGRERPAKPARRRRRLGRRVTAAAMLGGALVAVGGAYTLFAGTSGAADSTTSAADIHAGHKLYDVTCITCHGANLQGVKNRGVSLLGVGGAAVYFQVSTGRMPATGQGSDQQRKTVKFNDKQIRQLAAFVQSKGGGPKIPAGSVQAGDKALAEGGNLFRLNCASCHGTTFKGAPLSAGKSAPSLNEATPLQIYTAMLSGPESMPVFSDNQITPAQKRAIVAYIETMKASDDPGGSGIDRIGPASEAIVAWVGGIGALMVVILWIGAKTQ
jgi:ubiquinol-cytochrome c reductase cytochrome c subunit